MDQSRDLPLFVLSYHDLLSKGYNRFHCAFVFSSFHVLGRFLNSTGVKFPSEQGTVRAPIITPDDRRVDKDAELAMRMQEQMDLEHNSRRTISNPPAYVEENVSESILARNAGVIILA